MITPIPPPTIKKALGQIAYQRGVRSKFLHHSSRRCLLQHVPGGPGDLNLKKSPTRHLPSAGKLAIPACPHLQSWGRKKSKKGDQGMQTREILSKQISDFKARYGVQDQDEHIITTIHLTNVHRLDLSSAQDQTSHGAGDHGIDGWQYDEKSCSLYIYQSKLSQSKTTVLAGLSSLQQAADWL